MSWVWIVDVDGKRLVFEAVTKPGHAVEQEIGDIIRSIRPWLGLSLPSETRGHLGHVSHARRAFGEVTNEPPSRRRLGLRRSSLEVQMDEHQRILEREGLALSSGVLSGPQRATLDRSAKAACAWG
jgi:hypothetical protein